MRKLLSPREWIGTGIQLMIFALLIPYLAILIGMIMESAPAAKDSYAAAALSLLPYSDAIQNVVTGYNLSVSGMSFLTYTAAIMSTIEDSFVAAMYLGMWLYAFRVIFSEILPIRGLPILQHVCGLFFGALTYSMLQEGLMMSIMVTLFLFVLNIVITIIFVHKAIWKKLLELILNLSLQSYLAALTIAYVAVIASCVQGLYANVTQAVTSVVVVTLLWLIYLITQYIVTSK